MECGVWAGNRGGAKQQDTKTPTPASCELLEERRLLSGCIYFADQTSTGTPSRVSENSTLTLDIGIYDPSASSWSAGPHPGVYWHAPVTVNYTISGQAGANDLIASGSYTIPAWLQWCNMDDPERVTYPGRFYVPIQIAADNLVEGDESLIITLTTSSGLTVGYPAPGFPSSPEGPAARSFVIADDPPVVSIEPWNASAEEGEYGYAAVAGSFKITRTGGDVTQPLDVSLAYSGSATRGQDYDMPDSVAVGSEAIVSFNATSDRIKEDAESVIATLQPGSNYLLSSRVTARGTIQASGADLAISGPGWDPSTNTLTIKRSQITGVPLDCTLTKHGGTKRLANQLLEIVETTRPGVGLQPPSIDSSVRTDANGKATIAVAPFDSTTPGTFTFDIKLDGGLLMPITIVVTN